MGHNLIEALEAIHIDYNRREGKDDSFLDNNSIAGLLGPDLGLDVDGYFNRYGLKNPVEFVANMWLEWIKNNYSESFRLDPDKNEEYFNKVKYPALKRMVVPEWKEMDTYEVLEMLHEQELPSFLLSGEHIGCDNPIYGQLTLFTEDLFTDLIKKYQEYIKVYGSSFTFYSYGVEDAAAMIFNCFDEGIDFEEGLKILCSNINQGFIENGLSESDYLFYAYGVKHSFDIISKHQMYRQDNLQEMRFLDKIVKVFS